MANLIPLNLDKDTGKIIARGGRGGGLGSDTAGGFLFEQLAPSDTWNVPHNQENDRVLVQIYDETGNFTIPDEIIIVDINNIQILFNAPMEGTAHILFFNSQQQP